MITIKCKTKNKIDVSEYCRDYSHAFRTLYTNFELSQDKNFQEEFRKKYNVDSWIYQCLVLEVRTKLKQTETITKNKEILLERLEKELKEDDFENKKWKKYKIQNRIAELKRWFKCGEKGWAKGGKITFGSKSVLRKITHLHNEMATLKKRVLNKIFTEKDKKKLIKEKQADIKEWTDQYHKNRVLKYCIIGEAPQNSNRKLDFDFKNKKVVFKPKNGTKIDIEFNCSKGQHRQLLQLQEHIGELAISIKLDDDYIHISYDEQKLNGFAHNDREYFKEIKLIPKKDKKARKECYIKWEKEQLERMYGNKNKFRYICVDLNPEYIGFAIIERDKDNPDKFRILVKKVISFKKLNTKLGLSSTDPKQIKQNRKRIHELNEAWKYIFEIGKRWKAGNFVVEDLWFEEKSVNDKSAEANRKIRQFWHRTRTTNLITKYCNTRGINLIPVNGCYTSFIGNIKHNYYDPINAALEVGRRGMNKYLKDKFYPSMERSDLDTMYQFGLDVRGKNISWVEAYDLFNTRKLRYRRELTGFVESNLLSPKSRVIVYDFV